MLEHFQACLKKLITLKKEHYSNFCTFEFASLVIIPRNTVYVLLSIPFIKFIEFCEVRCIIRATFDFILYSASHFLLTITMA